MGADHPRRPGIPLRVAREAKQWRQAMPGTVKLWWHDGSTRDARYHPTILINEPELGFETVAVSSTPASSGVAPGEAYVAAVETDVDLRYRVLAPSQSGDAADPEAKPLRVTGFAVATIGVQPGFTISFLEV